MCVYIYIYIYTHTYCSIQYNVPPALFADGRGLGRQHIYCVARLEGLLGIMRGITPRRRGVIALPTRPQRRD